MNVYSNDKMRIPDASDVRYSFSDVIAEREGVLKDIQLKDARVWRLCVEQFRKSTPECGVDDADKGWRCEYWGKLMRGAVFTYRSSGDEGLYSLLEETVRDMLAAQDSVGRFSTYSVEKEFDGWDMWGRKYILLGFIYFLDICKSEALANEIIGALIRHADYIIERIGDGEGKRPIGKTSTHWDSMNSCSILEPFVLLYNKTGIERYLDFASYIVSVGGTGSASLFDIAYENKTAIKDYPQTKAYEMMSCFDGLAEYLRIRPNARYLTALTNFVNRIIDEEVSVIGCLGCNFESFDGTRHTQFAPDMERHIMQETCVTVTWMKLCLQMLRLTGDPTYADELERSTYNAFIGAILMPGEVDEEANFSVPLPVISYSPLRRDKRSENTGGRKNVDENGTVYGCCVAIAAAGFGVASFASVMETERGYAMNLYRNGRVEFTGDGKRTVFDTTTEYPVNTETRIKIESDREEPFEVSLRVPEYARSADITVKEGYSTVGDGVICVTVKQSAEIVFTPDCPTRLLRPGDICPDTDVNDVFCVTSGCLTMACDERLADVEGGICVDDAPVFMNADAEALGANKAVSLSTKDGNVLLVDYASAGRGKERPFKAAWIKRKQ
jgi:DUF1680 family protein